MDSEVRAKIHELLDACLDSDTDVWMCYHPHINEIEVFRTNEKHYSEAAKVRDLDDISIESKNAVAEFNKIIKKVKEYDNV